MTKKKAKGPVRARFKLARRKTVKLTMTFAQRYMDLPSLPGERPVREDHVLLLAEKLIEQSDL